MTKKNLTQLLEQLHTELDSTAAVDDKGRELLRTLSADIEELLERSGDADESLLERLQESIDRFSEQHPALTTVLSHLLTALNNAGI
jgi:CII-binding regulator of phage lambda lysogenization HflD